MYFVRMSMGMVKVNEDARMEYAGLGMLTAYTWLAGRSVLWLLIRSSRSMLASCSMDGIAAAMGWLQLFPVWLLPNGTAVALELLLAAFVLLGREDVRFPLPPSTAAVMFSLAVETMEMVRFRSSGTSSCSGGGGGYLRANIQMCKALEEKNMGDKISSAPSGVQRLRPEDNRYGDVEGPLGK